MDFCLINGSSQCQNLAVTVVFHPGGNPGANLKSISHRCHPILVAYVWELTKETIYLPLGCIQGGLAHGGACVAGKGRWQ